MFGTDTSFATLQYATAKSKVGIQKSTACTDPSPHSQHIISGRICNLPPCFEVFNNVITLSQYFNMLFSYKIIGIYCPGFIEVGSLDINRFDGFLNCSIDFKTFPNYPISWDIDFIQACTTSITNHNAQNKHIRLLYITVKSTSSNKSKTLHVQLIECI